jgi:hypothetical protein
MERGTTPERHLDECRHCGFTRRGHWQNDFGHAFVEPLLDTESRRIASSLGPRIRAIFAELRRRVAS